MRKIALYAAQLLASTSGLAVVAGAAPAGALTYPPQYCDPLYGCPDKPKPLKQDCLPRYNQYGEAIETPNNCPYQP